MIRAAVRNAGDVGGQGNRGATAWLNVVSAARSTGSRPSSRAWLAATRSVWRFPAVLALVSSASTTFNGISAVSTSSIVCTTPLSRSSKSAAASPPTGLPPVGHEHVDAHAKGARPKRRLRERADGIRQQKRGQQRQCWSELSHHEFKCKADSFLSTVCPVRTGTGRWEPRRWTFTGTRGTIGGHGGRIWSSAEADLNRVVFDVAWKRRKRLHETQHVFELRGQLRAGFPLL